MGQQQTNRQTIRETENVLYNSGGVGGRNLGREIETMQIVQKEFNSKKEIEIKRNME